MGIEIMMSRIIMTIFFIVSYDKILLILLSLFCSYYRLNFYYRPPLIYTVFNLFYKNLKSFWILPPPDKDSYLILSFSAG